VNEWIARLKVAAIEENWQQMHHLLENIPQNATADELQTAMALIEGARRSLEAKKEETARQMQEILQAKKFLASQEDATYLDITS
jgi:hypothetical protein